MSRGIFGWDYPPGVSSADIDDLMGEEESPEEDNGAEDPAEAQASERER